MKKRIASMFTAVMLAVSLIAVMPMTVGAADEIIQYKESGDYKYYVLDDGTVEIVRYLGSDTTVTIPSEIDGKTVTSVGYQINYPIDDEPVPGAILDKNKTGAFQNCKAESIILPDTVKTINQYAFACCENLVNIKLSNILETICCFGIYDCDKLTSLTLPDSLTILDYKAIFQCINLKTITLPKGIKFIDESALGYTDPWWMTAKVEDFTIKCYSGSAGESYAIENSFKYVLIDEDEEYYKSGDYEYKVLDDGTAEIVRYNGNETSVVIPAKLDGIQVTSIGKKVIKNDEESSEPVNNSTYCINAAGAFSESDVVSVTVPESVTQINTFAFAGCSSLTSLELPKSLKHISSAGIYNCQGLTSLNLPEGLESLEQCAVYNCENLTSITIPKSVISIGIYAVGFTFAESNFFGTPDLVNNFLIRSYSDSAAEKYAINNIPYELLDASATAELKYQLRPNDNGTTDVRFVLVADEADVLNVASASVYASVPDDEDTASVTIRKAYKSLIAGGKTITADEGKVFLIGKFVGIPEDMLNGITAHFTLGENTYDRTI